MLKDKPFINSLRQMNLQLNQAYQKSRSLSAKRFIKEPMSFSPEKKNMKMDQHNRRQLGQNPQKINQNNGQSKLGYEKYNVRSELRIPQNIFEPKRVYLKNSVYSDLPKSNLVRSQSAGQVYQYHRIEMLKKMNGLLEDHVAKSKQNQAKKENQRKLQFQNQIKTKLDRLENYLHKIKSQRSKQYRPKNIIQHKETTRNVQKLETVQNVFSNFGPNKVSNQLQNVLDQLDKIKQQLIKVRSQAFSVKEKNSLSKNKQPKLNTQQVQKSHLNQIQTNLSNLRQNKLIPAEFSIRKDQPNLNNFRFHKIQDINSHRLRTNNHISSFQLKQKISQQFNNLHGRNILVQKQSLSKPKITFSFSTTS